MTTQHGMEAARERDEADTAVDETEAVTETSYLPRHTSTQANERWQQIQAEFVDDPRKSVTEAHQLVSELVQRIAIRSPRSGATSSTNGRKAMTPRPRT